MNTNDLLKVIRDPGKFEGETEAIRILWEEYVMNLGEDYILYNDETPVSVFFLDDTSESAAIIAITSFFPDAYAILLWEDNYGFVNTLILLEKEYLAYVNSCEYEED